MFKFSGDEDNLEGKVIIYSKLKRDSDLTDYIDKEIFAMYVATNPEDYVEKIGVPEYMIDDIISQLEETTQKLSQRSEIKIVSAYIMPIHAASEDELRLEPENLFYVGEYFDPKSCMAAVYKGAEFYLLMFEDQLSTNHKLGNLSKEEYCGPTYHDFEGKDIKEYVIKNFVKPMIEAKQCNEDKSFKDIKRDFIGFSAGSHFISDVLDLCSYINKHRLNINTNLSDAYIDKLSAIHIENYEKAAKMRDEIGKLKDNF